MSDIPFALLYARYPASGAATLVDSRGLDGADARGLSTRRCAGASMVGSCWPGGSEEPIALADELTVALPGGTAPEPGTHVFISEIAAPATTTQLGGLVVFGISPRLTFDCDYRDHLVQLSEHLSWPLSRIEAFLRAAIEAERSNLFLQAPAATALMTGPDHAFEVANCSTASSSAAASSLARPTATRSPSWPAPSCRASSTGSIARQALRDQRVPRAPGLRRRRRGRGLLLPLQPRAACATPTGQVYGIMAVAVEVTEQVVARRVLEKRLRRARQAARRAGIGQPRQGRVPRHARPRAAQPARADRHRARADAAATAPAIETRARDHRAPGRRTWSRLVDDLLDVSRITRGKIELRKRARRDLRHVVAQRGRDRRARCSSSATSTLDVDVPRDGLVGRRRSGAAGAGAVEPADQRRQVHRRRRHDRDRRAARRRRASCIRCATTASASRRSCCRASSTCSCRSAQALDRAQGGLGLGLTIVQAAWSSCTAARVARSSDGLGQGQRVRRAAAASPSAGGVARRAGPSRGARRPRAGTAARPGRRRQRGRRRAARRGRCAMLGPRRRSVAHDGPAALAAARRASRPSVALLDIGLPVMDGYELARAAARRARRRALPADRAHRLRPGARPRAAQREAGFDAHLVKPVDLDELLRFVADLAERAELRWRPCRHAAHGSGRDGGRSNRRCLLGTGRDVARPLLTVGAGGRPRRPATVGDA